MSSSRFAVVGWLVATAFVAAGVDRAEVLAAQGPDRIIDIYGGSARFALPPCVATLTDAETLAACETITKVLRDDLRFEGLFKFVEKGLYRALRQSTPDAPDFEDWRSLFANYLVTTRAAVRDGELTLDLWVYSVDSGQLMRQKRYGGPASEPRSYAHQASDDIMALTQFRGVAQTKIAFTSDRDASGRMGTKELYLMDYDGHRPRRITVNRSLNILPAWSPDGRTLAYVSYRSGTPDVYLAAIYEGRSSNLTGGVGQSFAPSWSPDGRRLAFAGNRSGNMDIWIVNADGTDLRRLTSTAASETAPTWSPTGREIAFTSNRGGTPQVWVADADGLNLRRITRVGSYNDAPSWSPSRLHSEIAYSSRLEGGTFEIAIVDLGTGAVRQITTGHGSCESPSWAPNGRHLAFSCNRRGRWQIGISDRLGYDVRRLPAGPGNNAQPDWEPS